MTVIDCLFDEHDLILKMVALLQKKPLPREKIDTVVDFFKIYADMCHHGKEESIFFRRLTEKPLSPDLKALLEELLGEHRKARKLVQKLQTCPDGEIQSVKDEIVKLYLNHIEKENSRFFLPALGYFDKNEQAKLAKEFKAFDEKMIHRKYGKVVESFI